jgi:Ca2+/H+ antiporter
MIHKNMRKKYMVLMIGIMLFAMVILFMILGESAASAMVTGFMVLIMIVMIGIYLLAMFVLMKPKKGHHIHKMTCENCGKPIMHGDVICPSCGYENKMM